MGAIVHQRQSMPLPRGAYSSENVQDQVDSLRRGRLGYHVVWWRHSVWQTLSYEAVSTNQSFSWHEHSQSEKPVCEKYGANAKAISRRLQLLPIDLALAIGVPWLQKVVWIPPEEQKEDVHSKTRGIMPRAGYFSHQKSRRLESLRSLRGAEIPSQTIPYWRAEIRFTNLCLRLWNRSFEGLHLQGRSLPSLHCQVPASESEQSE